MEMFIAFVAGMTVIGVLFTANRAIDVWKASVVPNPRKDPELDQIRIALSQFDPETVLSKLDELAGRLDKLEKGGVAHAKLVQLFERTNDLTADMVEVKAMVVKLSATANWKALGTGRPAPAVPTDG